MGVSIFGQTYHIVPHICIYRRVTTLIDCVLGLYKATAAEKQLRSNVRCDAECLPCLGVCLVASFFSLCGLTTSPDPPPGTRLPYGVLMRELGLGEGRAGWHFPRELAANLRYAKNNLQLIREARETEIEGEYERIGGLLRIYDSSIKKWKI